MSTLGGSLHFFCTFPVTYRVHTFGVFLPPEIGVKTRSRDIGVNLSRPDSMSRPQWAFTKLQCSESTPDASPEYSLMPLSKELSSCHAWHWPWPFTQVNDCSFLGWCQMLSMTSVSLPQMVILFQEAAWEHAESIDAGPRDTCPLRPPPPAPQRAGLQGKVICRPCLHTSLILVKKG